LSSLIATSGVVLSTLRHAADADYRRLIVGDCCSDGDEDAHRVLLEKDFPRQATIIGALVGNRTDAGTVFDLHLGTGVANAECIHAPKRIAAAVANRTSFLPDVSAAHGSATYRPRHQRIREPCVRVWQVLHDENCSCGD
jgi:hypothetical protein